MKNFVMGVDIGQKGGWAISSDPREDVMVSKMPVVGDEVNVKEIADVLSEYKNIGKIFVVMEKVHAMPKQGVSSTFKFGVNFGKVIGMCQAMGVAYDFVLPNRWKKDILYGTEMDKPAAIAYVSRTLPHINLVPPGCKVPHHGIADAVCMMLWGLKKYA